MNIATTRLTLYSAACPDSPSLKIEGGWWAVMVVLWSTLEREYRWLTDQPLPKAEQWAGMKCKSWSFRTKVGTRQQHETGFLGTLTIEYNKDGLR